MFLPIIRGDIKDITNEFNNTFHLHRRFVTDILSTRDNVQQCCQSFTNIQGFGCSSKYKESGATADQHNFFGVGFVRERNYCFGSCKKDQNRWTFTEYKEVKSGAYQASSQDGRFSQFFMSNLQNIVRIIEDLSR